MGVWFKETSPYAPSLDKDDQHVVVLIGILSNNHGARTTCCTYNAYTS